MCKNKEDRYHYGWVLIDLLFKYIIIWVFSTTGLPVLIHMHTTSVFMLLMCRIKNMAHSQENWSQSEYQYEGQVCKKKKW